MAPKKQTKKKTKPSAKAAKPPMVPSPKVLTPLTEKPVSEVSLELLATIAAQVYPHVEESLEHADREQFSVKVAAGIIQCAARELEKSSALPLKEDYTFNEFVTALTGDANSTRATQMYVDFLGWKRPLSVDRNRFPKITAKVESEAREKHQAEIFVEVETLKQKGFTLCEAKRERFYWAKYKQGQKYDWLEFQK